MIRFLQHRDSGLEAREIRLIPLGEQFMQIPPRVIFELLWTHLAMTQRLGAWRVELSEA